MHLIWQKRCTKCLSLPLVVHDRWWILTCECACAWDYTLHPGLNQVINWVPSTVVRPLGLWVSFHCYLKHVYIARGQVIYDGPFWLPHTPWDSHVYVISPNTEATHLRNTSRYLPLLDPRPILLKIHIVSLPWHLGLHCDSPITSDNLPSPPTRVRI